MTEHISGREFGALEQQVQHLDEKVQKLERSVEGLTEKMDELIGLANKGRGAWWAGITAASALGAIATLVVSFFTIR